MRNLPQHSDQIAALNKEIETLSQQVKRLIKAEAKLYEFQETLDAQLNEYAGLYELNKTLNNVFDLQDVFACAVAYAINNLGYQRVLLFQQNNTTGSYTVFAVDGYYKQQEKNAVMALAIAQGDPLLTSLCEGPGYLVCPEECGQGLLAGYRSRLLMNEYLIYQLGSRSQPLAFLVVGNSGEDSRFYRRVEENESTLLGIGNFAEMISSSLENKFYYAKMKNALEQESLAKARYRSIFENSLDGIYQSTLNGRFINCNPAAASILGYESPEDLIETIHDTAKQLYVYPHCREELLAMLMSRQNVKNYETEFYRKDGSAQWVMLGMHPTFDVDGKLLYLDGIIQDITERKRMEEELRNEKEKYCLLVRQVPGIVFKGYADYGLDCFDDKIETLTGYTQDEFNSRVIKWNDVLLEEYHASVREQLKKALKEDGFYVSEFRIRKKSGEMVWVQARNQVVKNTRGTMEYISGVFFDITERKLGEDALRESEERFSRFFRASPISTSITRLSNGQLVDINDAFMGLSGYTRVELVGQDILRLEIWVNPEDRYKMTETLEEQDRIQDFETRFRKKSGEVRDVLVSAEVIEVAGQQYILGLTNDITESKRAEEEKKRLEAQLLQGHKLEAIGTLAGGIAHDFNNILTPIIGYAEMALSDTPQFNLMRHRLEQILTAAIRARELVKQILAFGRSDKEQRHIPVEISLVVKEALKLLRASLPSSIEIRQEIDSGVVLANATQIHQILMNLCTNAAHAMDGKGILEVCLSRVDLRETDLSDPSMIDLKPGPHLMLRISDTGVGMDARTIERIFDPYFTTKEVGKGSGLGLAVVNGIVRRHKGANTVQSEPGKGTTFSIYLPATDASIAEVVETKQELPMGTERILLIDDEQIVVEMETAILELLGYDVTPETDSLRALEIFRSRPEEFDLVVTDYTMPKLTGTDLSSAIRQIRADIPIILCTGFSEKVTEEGAMDLGMELVMKPFSMKQIAESVRKALGAAVS